MENWFRYLFLGLFTGLFLNTANAADETNRQQALIQPEIARVQFDEAQINADDFELMLFAGYLSIEDFGVNSLLSAKFNYYVNESVFVQLTLAQSSAGETSYEVLSGGAPLLTESEREVESYAVNIGYNLLPGETFPSENSAFNTAFFISGGIGNTSFAGSDRFTWNYGAGLRFLLNDSFSLYSEFRNNVFDVDVFGTSKSTNNLEFTIGAGWFF